MFSKMKYILLASIALSASSSQACGYGRGPDPDSYPEKRICEVITRFEATVKPTGHDKIELKKMFNTPYDDADAGVYFFDPAVAEGPPWRSLSYDERRVLESWRKGDVSRPTYGDLAELHHYGDAVSTILHDIGFIRSIACHDPTLSGGYGSSLPLSRVLGPGTVETNECRKMFHEFLLGAFTENFYPSNADWLNSQDLTVRELWEMILPHYKESKR